MHGMHQVPQKSITVTFPRRCSKVKDDSSKSVTRNSGEMLPALDSLENE